MKQMSIDADESVCHLLCLSHYSNTQSMYNGEDSTWDPQMSCQLLKVMKQMSIGFDESVCRLLFLLHYPSNKSMYNGEDSI